MIDRRLVRKVLMQYKEGVESVGENGDDSSCRSVGCSKGGGMNHSADDPIDLLAVIF